jgi:hypothetical protein
LLWARIFTLLCMTLFTDNARSWKGETPHTVFFKIDARYNVLSCYIYD